MKFICYEKCSTCKAIQKLMDEKNLDYEFRSIKGDNPTRNELEDWHQKSGLDIKRFFNTSGLIYRENNLKDKLADMSLEEKYDLLATDGMLVKRPILIDKDKIFIGPDVKKYIEEK